MRQTHNSYGKLSSSEQLIDSRIQLHSDDDFRDGINYKTKLIGVQSVPRPVSRVEIVAAMRKIRFECKSRRDKKRKVNIHISLNGVSIALLHKANQLQIASHPIHRIFYVSHDSLDLHIFSYIAREQNSFKCFVFKCHKKNLALEIVRTIGQAFDVCHHYKYNNDATNDDNNDSSPTANQRTNHNSFEFAQLMTELSTKMDALMSTITAIDQRLIKLEQQTTHNNTQHNQHSPSQQHNTSLFNATTNTQSMLSQSMFYSNSSSVSSPDKQLTPDSALSSSLTSPALSLLDKMLNTTP